MVLTIVCFGIALLIFALMISNAKVKRAPMAQPMEAYLEKPEGEEGYLERKDGTRILFICAGSGQPIVLAH